MKIFVTGKFGTGKSTFINGLFNGRIEPKVDGEAPRIQVYTFETGSGSVIVYDTPGQELNSTSYLQWMQEECSDVDIFFFCLQMTDQVRPEDVQALSTLTTTFRFPILNRIVFILTRANQVEPLDPRKESKGVYYKRILSAMTRHIKSVLTDSTQSIGLSTSLVNSTPIVPVGHPQDYSLPGCSDWRSAVIDASFTCVGTPGKALLKQVIEDDSLTVSHHNTIIAPTPASFLKQMGTTCTNGVAGMKSCFRGQLCTSLASMFRTSLGRQNHAESELAIPLLEAEDSAQY